MIRRNHLLGWMLVAGNSPEHDLRRMVNSGLEGFVGDFGTNKHVVTAQGIAFGLLAPTTPLPMLTWSFYEGAQFLCFVEGDFYADYCRYRPLCGRDPQLAEILVRNYNTAKCEAISALSGCFSGFLFDRQSSTLSSFVDRLGLRVLYWSYEKNILVVSSNLASFRRLRSLDLDREAAFEFLTVGFPIGERTLLKNVSIQLPCTINVFRSGGKRSSYYWVPKRSKKAGLEDTVESIVHSMEKAIDRISDRTDGKILGLGLTGGKDSRLILSALAYRHRNFELVRWAEHNFNNPVAQQLCRLMNVPLHMTSVGGVLKDDLFVYSDGFNMWTRGFSALGKECAERGTEHLLLGFGGDVINGSLTIPEPEHFDKISNLARYALRSQMELLSFEKARDLLTDVCSDVIEETKIAWEDSFRAEEWRETFSDIAIWQRLPNRNLKRIRNVMVAGFQYTQLIFPYVDSVILESYFSAPVEHIQYQRAHCYAVSYRFKQFKNYRTTGFPVPLEWEARLPSVLHSLRMLRDYVQSLERRMEYDRSLWNAELRKCAHEVCNSPVFNRREVEKLFSKNRVQHRSVRKMYILAKFFDFYVQNIKCYESGSQCL